MDIPRLYFERHDDLRTRLARLAELPEEQWRARPHGMNSIAWLVWHVARVEDGGINRLVFDRPQVLDDPAARWPERMRVPHRHHGTTMTSAEVDDLTSNADVQALVAYAAAVGARTHELVDGLRSELLDEVVGPDEARRVLVGEGLLRAEYEWKDPLSYTGQTRGRLLMHFGLTHPFGHLNDVLTVRGFLGFPSL